MEAFTTKELAVIHGIARGKRNKAIAAEMDTSEQVVKNYLKAIYRKTQGRANDRLTLGLWWVREGQKLHEPCVV